MQTSYKKLWKMLIDLEVTKKELREATGLSTGTMTKLTRDEDVSMDALKRICKICRCNIGDIVDFVPNEK